MKVSKEDVIGVLTALEYWFEERDPAAERQKWHDDLAAIAERLGGARRRQWRSDRAGRRRPGAAAAGLWDRGTYPLDGLELRQRVLDGEPRIMLDDNRATENSIAIDPFQLQPGEAAQVGEAWSRRVARASDDHTGAARSRRRRRSPAIGNCGSSFCKARAIHRLALAAAGTELAGHQHSVQFEGPVGGRLDGDLVRFSFTSATRRARSAIASRARSATAR